MTAFSKLYYFLFLSYVLLSGLTNTCRMTSFPSLIIMIFYWSVNRKNILFSLIHLLYMWKLFFSKKACLAEGPKNPVMGNVANMQSLKLQLWFYSHESLFFASAIECCLDDPKFVRGLHSGGHQIYHGVRLCGHNISWLQSITYQPTKSYRRNPTTWCCFLFELFSTSAECDTVVLKEQRNWD